MRKTRIILSAEKYPGPYHDGMSINKWGELKHAELFIEVFAESLRLNGGPMSSVPVTVIDPSGKRPLDYEFKSRISQEFDVEFVDIFGLVDDQKDEYDPKVHACAWAESQYDEDVLLFMDYDIVFGDGEHIAGVIDSMEPGDVMLTETRSWQLEPEFTDHYDITAPNKYLSCVVGVNREDKLFGEWKSCFKELKRTLDLSKVSKSLEEYALMLATERKGMRIVDYCMEDERFKHRLDFWKSSCAQTYHYISVDGLHYYASENKSERLDWIVRKHFSKLPYDFSKLTQIKIGVGRDSFSSGSDMTEALLKGVKVAS